MSLFANADVNDAYGVFKENAYQFNALSDEYYAMMSLIRMIDAIAGKSLVNGPQRRTLLKSYYTDLIPGCERYDFCDEKWEDLQKLNEHLISYGNKIKADAGHSDGARVKELISLMTNKWKVLKARADRNK